MAYLSIKSKELIMPYFQAACCVILR